MRALVRTLSIVLLAAGCSRGHTRPNIVLISVDTLRADHLSCYGYPRATSPHLDRLAAEGIVFERAFAQSSWTLASHMSLFTSRYPHNHGVETPRKKLAPEIPLLTEELARAGYRTTGFVTWAFLDDAYGFGRGFDAYHELLPPEDKRGAEHGELVTRADEAIDRVLAFVNADRDERPFFLFVHLFDPHLDYQAPREHVVPFDPAALPDDPLGRHETLRPYIKFIHQRPKRIPPAELARVTALYDGEVRFTDTQLGRLFDALEHRSLLDETAVFFTSDHGEELDDHGSMEGHGWTLYDEILHVPLIVRLPGGANGGTRVTDIVDSIDVAPTILALARVPTPDSFEGKSLVPWLGGGRGRTVPSFSSSERFLRRQAVRTERYKLIRSERKTDLLPHRPPRIELFDLAADPGEEVNVLAQEPEVAARLEGLLEAWLAERHTTGAGEAVLSAEERARIRALGYADDE